MFELTADTALYIGYAALVAFYLIRRRLRNKYLSYLSEEELVVEKKLLLSLRIYYYLPFLLIVGLILFFQGSIPWTVVCGLMILTWSIFALVKYKKIQARIQQAEFLRVIKKVYIFEVMYVSAVVSFMFMHF
jgi:hypothetical protein